MQPQVQHMLEKLENLPPERLAEIEDFIDFLRQREQENRLRKEYTKASEASFQKIWDNDEDAVYDNF